MRRGEHFGAINADVMYVSLGSRGARVSHKKFKTDSINNV